MTVAVYAALAMNLAYAKRDIRDIPLILISRMIIRSIRVVYLEFTKLSEQR